MLTYFKGLLIMILLSILLPLLPREALAVDHVVRSVITVPLDWRGRVTSEQKTQYKIAIIQTTKRVQAMYAQILSGKTFQLSEDVPVEEILFPSQVVNFKLGANLYDQLGKNILGFDKGAVIVNWVIGGEFRERNVGARGHPYNPDSGEVWMPHRALLDIVSDEDSDQKRWALTLLAHELGHAFGLNYAGFAKGHPCTEVSANECINGAPKPYPSANEWKSIMGYATPFVDFPKLSFNNTIFNPEIQKIYQSPFINPNHDPAPEPTVDAGVKVPDIFRFGSEQTIGVGKIFNIPNNGNELFGGIPGKIEFISTLDKITTLPQDAYKVRKWDSSGIEIFIKEDAVSAVAQSRWKLRITTANSRVWQAEEDIVIKGKNFDKPSLILTASLLTTCGEKRQPISAPVNFFAISASKDVGTSVITDGSTGKGEISLEVEDPRVGDIYALAPLDLPGVLETPKATEVVVDGSDIQARQKLVDSDVHYPTCLAAKNSQPIPMPTPKETVSPTPSVTMQPGLTSTPAPVCPVSTDNCVYSEGDQCYSGYTNDTSTCTWINGTCLNPTADCSYSCGPLVSCPSSASVKLTPIPSSSVEPTLVPTPIATPQPSPYSTSEPTPTPTAEQTQVLISNYSDFRGDNAPGDAGSPTMTINNPSGQTVTWKLSTLVPSLTRRVFVRTITGEEYKDYEPLEMRDSGIVSVAGINIQARMVKRVVKMTVTVNGQDQEIDLNNPEEIITRLPGNAGQAQRFSLPFIIEYSNGEVVRSAIGINYQPVSSPAPSSLSTPTPFSSVSEILVSTPTPSACTEIEQYNECIACNTSRRISKDSCGNYTTLVPSQSDSGCVSWCASSPSPEISKKIVRVTVNEQEIDPNELYSGFRLNLPGVTGQPQTFSVPMVIYYSDGSRRNFVYTFNYQPSTPNQQSCPYEYKYPECDSNGPGWVHEVWQNCQGEYDIRNVQFQAGTCGDSWQQPSPQEDSCPEDRSDQYPQCGGTVGLEDKDPAHTYLITRVKDCQGNILRYEQEDLGDQGQCQN